MTPTSALPMKSTASTTTTTSSTDSVTGEENALGNERTTISSFA